MKYAVAVLAVAAAACGSPPPPSTLPAIVHSPCGPLVLSPPDDATAMQRDAVEVALQSWNLHGFTKLSTSGDGEPIALHFQPAFGAIHGLYDPDTGEVYVNSTMKDPDEIAIVVAHELGHAMGLPHRENDDGSVMKPGNLTIPPSAADDARLRESCTQ